jgi:ABC-type bacteriocin/lantibiotic exporter with double-glycine peptidase domain
METEESLIDRFPAIAALRWSGRNRIPFVQQLTAGDCGAACLAMTLGYHGKEVKLDDVRDSLGIGRDGVDALSLLRAAERFGLRGRGVSIELDELQLLEPGSILHWAFGHFVVFEGIHRDGIDIVDPAAGKRRVPRDEFSDQFTGVALLLERGDGFEPVTRNKKLVWRYLNRVLSQSGVLSRILAASILVQLFGLAAPVLTSAVVDRVVPRSDHQLLVVLGIGVVGLLVFDLMATLVRAELLLDLRTRLDSQLTLGFLDHLADLPYAFFQRRSAGDLLMRLNSNTSVREILSAGALSAVLDGSLVVIYLVILLAISKEMGVAVLVLAALQSALFFASRSRQRELMAENLAKEAKSASYQVEMLTGMETLKAMGSERTAVTHWSQLFVDVLNVSLRRGHLDAWIDSLTGALRLGSPLILLTLGAVLVMRTDLTLGSMLSASALSMGFLGPVANLVATAVQMQRVGSYLERLDDVFDAQVEQDGSVVRPHRTLTGHIQLEDVKFRYSPQAPLAVDGVSLEIQAGQQVAIVGRSGAGKSTLAHLLLGLHLPEAGRILYDGVDLKNCDLRSVRQQIGVVPQGTALFADSLRGNIALGNPEMPLERVISAARRAQLHEDILAMPLGYETLLVDRGASLSGGQRQRLALARALAREPRILLLDEATSALDAMTEQGVQRALGELNCTRIVIAHRLSTIIRSDLILVMEAGHLVEQGTHAELMAKGGAYARLTALPSPEVGAATST